MPLSGEDSSVDRRRFLEALGVAGTVGLAGCGGQPGGPQTTEDMDGEGTEPPQQELGERVPQLEFEYWSSVGTFEDTVKVGIETLEALGVQSDAHGATVAANVDNIANDKRTHDIALWLQPSSPGKADPVDLMDGWMIHEAGAAESFGNWANYASCEYTDAFSKVAFAATEEEQTKWVMEGHRIMSEDAPVIPIVGVLIQGAYRSDRLNAPDDLGALGVGGFTDFFIETTPKEGDAVRYDLSLYGFETAITPNQLSPERHRLIHSPLVDYNQDLEVIPALAKDWEITNEGKRYTFELRSGATFHNGEPITSEEVKWSYETYNETANTIGYRNQAPIESIEVVDDLTVEFNLTSPFLTLLKKTLNRNGVLYPPNWESFRENPQNPEPPDEIIGSGPYKVDSMELGQSMVLSPHDGNPIYDTPDHKLVFQVFRETQARNRAFLNGEIDVNRAITTSAIPQIENQFGDQAEIVRLTGVTPYYFMPQCSTPTSKFKEFRRAFATAFNRRKVNAIVFDGDSEEQFHGGIYPGTHPQVNADELPHFTDKPEGDVEKAKQILRDAGWGWDDNGNLHYPADADTGPAWPQGETPDPADFECLNPDGTYDGKLP